MGAGAVLSRAAGFLCVWEWSRYKGSVNVPVGAWEGCIGLPVGTFSLMHLDLFCRDVPLGCVWWRGMVGAGAGGGGGLWYRYIPPRLPLGTLRCSWVFGVGDGGVGGGVGEVGKSVEEVCGQGQWGKGMGGAVWGACLTVLSHGCHTSFHMLHNASQSHPHRKREESQKALFDSGDTSCQHSLCGGRREAGRRKRAPG